MAPGKKSAKKAAKVAAAAAAQAKSPTKPAATAKLAKAAKPAKPAKPAKAAKPAKPAKAAKPAKPAKPAKAAKPAKPAKAAKAPKMKVKIASKAGKGHKSRRRGEPDVDYANAALFEPLTEGEAADALRVMNEDRRLDSMAKVGRYRVAAIEPLVVKPPHSRAGFRLARIVVYDYASDRAVDVCVDLDHGEVVSLTFSAAQPMLAREEEAAAISLASADERVASSLSLGDEAQVAMHYWSEKATDLAHSRRSAAVLFGRSGGRTSIVAIVDLLDGVVTDVVPADKW